MRTLRETAGWGLTIALWVYPLVAPAVLIAALVRELPLGLGLLTALAGLAWPGLVLSAIRLRAPDPREVAEADGRRPVVLFHAFARSDVPWFARLLIVSPGFWRDLADHLQERALVRSLSAVGPVLPIARPAPAADHGPVRSLDPTGWEAPLRRALRRAALLAIVLDGRETDHRALAIGHAIVGLPRVVLVPPARLTAAFERRWSALRERVSGLPAIEARSVAFRYPGQGPVESLSARSPGLVARLALLRRPELMLRDGEAVAGPKPPSYAPFVGLLPVGAALIGALAVPEMLDVYHGIRLHNDAVPMGLLLVGLGVAVAVSSRRVWRLVPGSELPLVALAAAPWWGAELLTWMDGASLSRRLKATAVGAAYATPLLLSLAAVLALSALARRTPHRSRGFAVFGLAALIPFVPLGVTLDDARADAAMFGMALVAAAVLVPLVFWAASGDAGRRHAPLPVGAAVAAGLGLTAAGTVASHMAWRELLGGSGRHAARIAEALQIWDEAWPWFLLALPMTATVLAVAFRGRATRVSIGNLTTFAPLVLVVALASASHADARASLAASARSSVADMLRPVLGEGAALELPEMVAHEDALQPVEIALDARGAIVSGVYVAHPGQLSTRRGSAALARSLAVAARDGVVTVAVGREVQLDVLAGLASLAFREGAGELHVVVRAPDGLAGLVRFHDRRPNPGHVHLFMHVSSGGVTLADSGGYRYEVPARGGVQDASMVSLRLQDYRAQVPDRRVLLIAGRHARWGVVAPLCRTAAGHFPELALAAP